MSQQTNLSDELLFRFLEKSNSDFSADSCESGSENLVIYHDDDTDGWIQVDVESRIVQVYNSDGIQTSIYWEY